MKLLTIYVSILLVVVERGVYLKILVCDDDNESLKATRQLIDNWKIDKKAEFTVEEKTSGDFILTEKVEYDIAFIDIEMPGISGLELAEKLKELSPDIIVIVVTSFPDYLDNAMKIKVFRYLSKPLNENRFFVALSDAVRAYFNISKNIIVDLKNEVFSVKTKDILYLEKNKNGSTLHTRKGTFKTNKKVDEWLSVIDQSNCFVYSHSSFVVNLQNVVDFNNTEVKIRKSNDEIITTYMSQRKFRSFKKAFMSFVGVEL